VSAGEKAPAVVVDGVSKTFSVPDELTLTLKERVLHPIRSSRHHKFEALTDVSFAVDDGEFFGIVGRNGSGKSTLLKCMAGIYRADGGQIYMNGKVSPFIELGVGFNMDLAARDNVFMNAIMLGLEPARAKAIFEPVIEFAGLQQFTELKLKNYSSGMLVRLGFSVMVHVEADILLIDEVLAVGDANFQQKCFDAFARMREEGRTILLVTHDVSSVARFCQRAMLLEKGRIASIGEAHEIANRYLQINFEQDASGDPSGVAREGDGSARILDAWMEDEDGVRKPGFLHGERVRLRARAEVYRPLENPIVNFVLVTDAHVPVFAVSTLQDEQTTGSFAAGDAIEISVDFENFLGPGRHWIFGQLSHDGGGVEVIDRYERIDSFVVASARAAGGIVDLPHELRIERATPAGTRVEERSA
jgi:ABC-type polysaccharide/polyol phosphate transport system ATPase subunit